MMSTKNATALKAAEATRPATQTGRLFLVPNPTAASRTTVSSRGNHSRARLTLVGTSPWSITARVDPKRKMLHDFRNTVQELVYAVERADGQAVAGLANCLDGYLMDALYGGNQAA